MFGFLLEGAREGGGAGAIDSIADNGWMRRSYRRDVSENMLVGFAPNPTYHQTTPTTQGGHGLQAGGVASSVGGQRPRGGPLQRGLRVHPPRPGRRAGALLRRPGPRRRVGGHRRLELRGGAAAAALRRSGAGRAGAEPGVLRLVREVAGDGRGPVPSGVLRVRVPVGRAAVRHAGEGGRG